MGPLGGLPRCAHPPLSPAVLWAVHTVATRSLTWINRVSEKIHLIQKEDGVTSAVRAKRPEEADNLVCLSFFFFPLKRAHISNAFFQQETTVKNKD